MADYWKSNPRKFCDFCKCWFADNKSSIEFHERGKRHKENVEKKISELTKKGQKQYETQQELSGFLKEMEEGAMKAFQKDVSKNPNLVPEYKVALIEKKVRDQEEGGSSALSGSRYEPATAATSSGAQPTTSTTKGQREWVEALSPEGHTYYWNTVTGESQWDKPENFAPLASSAPQPDDSKSKKSEKEEEKEESSEESDDEEKSKQARGTKRPSDAYGGWTSISTEQDETPDLQLPEANPLYMSSYVPQAAQYEPREKLVIKEKTVGSISTTKKDSGNVSFKKRKAGARQIRSRDATS